MVMVALRPTKPVVSSVRYPGGGRRAAWALSAILFLVPPHKTLAVVTALALLAAAVAVFEMKMRRKWMRRFSRVRCVVAVVVPGTWLKVFPSPYKDLSQTMNIAGTRLIEERSSPLVEYRWWKVLVFLPPAPGMSLNATDEPPPQLGVFVDGNGPSALTQFDGDLEPLAYP